MKDSLGKEINTESFFYFWNAFASTMVDVSYISLLPGKSCPTEIQLVEDQACAGILNEQVPLTPRVCMELQVRNGH